MNAIPQDEVLELAPLRTVLLRHIARYPLVDIQDAAKLMYQHEFGCAHLIHDVGAAYRSLADEYAAIRQRPLPLLEDIGNGYSRLDLHALQANGVTVNEVFDWVVNTASSSAGSMPRFLRSLDLLWDESLGFDPERVKNFMRYYENSGYSPLNHSARFVAAYSPAYRVVLTALAEGRQII